MLDKKKKEKLISKFKTHANDTGSAQVQIAILTEEIKELTKHLKTHKKDFSSRRGLLKKVAERRRLLTYLRREDQDGFDKLVKELKIKVNFIAEEVKKRLVEEESNEEATEETEESKEE
ncbi:MAG: 30S ribosomal protein S15 [Candidatus Buchananbacteria bacterium]|nr:30S ribosomal protein S15 [Candidatus Buchananbacteria bacterium]